MFDTRNTWLVTVVLSFMGGYCDIVTFITANELFSAHVTGNFIVFAYDLVHGSDVLAWTKLLAFPVFVVSVMVGGWIAETTSHRYLLLFIEGILLLIAGLLAFTFKNLLGNNFVLYGIAMLIVFALGLQNAFGRIYSKETHGPTTMMTGNVTQASLDVGTLFRNKFQNAQALASLKKQLVTTGGFLIY